MSILLTDKPSEQYVLDVAKNNGRLSKAAALRLILDQHRRMAQTRPNQSSSRQGSTQHVAASPT